MTVGLLRAGRATDGGGRRRRDRVERQQHDDALLGNVVDWSMPTKPSCTSSSWPHPPAAAEGEGDDRFPRRSAIALNGRQPPEERKMARRLARQHLAVDPAAEGRVAFRARSDPPRHSPPDDRQQPAREDGRVGRAPAIPSPPRRVGSSVSEPRAPHRLRLRAVHVRHGSSPFSTSLSRRSAPARRRGKRSADRPAAPGLGHDAVIGRAPLAALGDQRPPLDAPDAARIAGCDASKRALSSETLSSRAPRGARRRRGASDRKARERGRSRSCPTRASIAYAILRDRRRRLSSPRRR